MRRTLAARVESGEKVHESFESHTVVLCRLVGESCHHRVEELPRRVAELSPSEGGVSGTLRQLESQSKHTSTSRSRAWAQ